MIVEKGFDLDICFPNGLRGDIMDKPTLRKLKAAGTFEITYAVETASPRLQKLIRKHVKLDKLQAVIEETVEMGIFTKGFFMMGFPSETREEVLQTSEYATKSKLHWMNILAVNSFPGTDLADIAEGMGIHINYDEIDYSKGYAKTPVQLGEMTVEEIGEVQKKTFFNFLWNRRRIASAFRCYRDKHQIFLFVFTTILSKFLPASKRARWMRWFYVKAYDARAYFRRSEGTPALAEHEIA